MIRFSVKKVINKIFFLIIICFLAFIFLAMCILYLLETIKETAVFYKLNSLNNFYQAMVLIPLMVVIYIIIFLILKRLASGKKGRIIIYIISVIFFLRFTVFLPHRIINVDIGPYKKDELVFSYLRFLYPFHYIPKNKIVVFRNDTISKDEYPIGTIEAIKEDELVQKAYERQGDIPVLVISHGDYLIKYGENQYIGVLNSDISSIVWFPFR